MNYTLVKYGLMAVGKRWLHPQNMFPLLLFIFLAATETLVDDALLDIWQQQVSCFKVGIVGGF